MQRILGGKLHVLKQLSFLVGFDLRRREWCLINCFRCDTGRCAASLHQWHYSDNPLCIYGDTQSMSYIIISASLKVVSQIYTPLLIPPESDCADVTAYAKERFLDLEP